jgi:glyoxylase-like metal-dependent hydrolase (beta-lactamase superfamily II)
VLKGTEMTDIGGNLIAIPVPGHTRGSVVYLWRDAYLLPGDSLAWSRETLVAAGRSPSRTHMGCSSRLSIVRSSRGQCT